MIRNSSFSTENCLSYCEKRKMLQNCKFIPMEGGREGEREGERERESQMYRHFCNSDMARL